MSIDLACDRCDRRYTFGDDQVGVHFRCQVCGKLLRVPVPVVPVDQSDEGATGGEWEDDNHSLAAGPPSIGVREVHSIPPPLPPPPVPAWPRVPATVSSPQPPYPEEPDARVSSADFWNGMIVPLAAVAAFIVATGVYGIYARSRPPPAVTRTTPAPPTPRNNPAPAPNPQPRRYSPPVQPPVDRRSRPSPAPPQISRPPRNGFATEAPAIPDVDVSKLEAWEPADVGVLGEAVAVGEYSIRGPKGWTRSGAPGGTSQFWVGPRSEGSSISPRLAVTVRPRTDRVRRRVPAVLTGPGQRTPSGAGSVIVAPGGSVEYGVVNGIAVAKVKMQQSSLRRRIQYAAYEGENYILIDATFDAKDEEGPGLVDAAVRSLGRAAGRQ